MFIETHTLSWKFIVCKFYYILLSAYHRSQKVFKCILRPSQCVASYVPYKKCLIAARTSSSAYKKVQSNLNYPNLHYPKPRLSGWGFHLHFHLIRTARVKIQTSSCSILLFLVLLPSAMASIKHKRVVRTT